MFALKKKRASSAGSSGRTVTWALTAGLAGYGVLHPLVMIISRLMSGQKPLIHIDIVSSLMSAFSPEMLPWGIGLGLLSAAVGMLLARNRHARAQKLKLQAVMELTGAACHELHQPMQVISGYAELLRTNMDESDTLHQPLREMVEQIDKMGCILKKMRNIKAYVTHEYIRGIRIIDLERASKVLGECNADQSSANNRPAFSE